MSPPRAFVVALLAGTAVLAWLLLAPLHAAVRAAAVGLLVLLPAWTFHQARLLRDLDDLPRLPVYVSSIIALAVLAALAAAAAAAGGMPRGTLGLRAAPAGATLAWAGVATVAAIGFVFLCRGLGVRETPVTLHLLPRTGPERAGFAALSLAAGLFEEFLYRGFLLGALLSVTDSTVVAGLIAAGAFGLVHGYQAPAGVARAFVLGVLLTAPVLATGSLAASMIAHAAIDLALGLALADRLRT